MKEKILLLHGALGSKVQFDKIIADLSDKYDTYTLNFEGHGDNQSSANFSMALFSKNVIDFLDDNNLDSINIFGYSMGGYVALNTALHSPYRIKTILTLGTKFNWSLDSAQKQIKMLDPEIIEEKVPHFAKHLESIHGQSWKEVLGKTANMMLNMGKGNRLEKSDIKKIDHNIVLGLGSLDNMVSEEETINTSSLLQTARMEILDGVKHPIETVSPETIIAFIKKHI